MNIRISLICTLVMALILTACAPAQDLATPTSPPTPTATVLPSPAATDTIIVNTKPSPTLTETPLPPTLASSQSQLLELLNNVTFMNGGVITQTDTTLEGLVWPVGIEDFKGEPYVNKQQGWQIQDPKNWVLFESPDMSVFSPDEEHTLCPFVLDIEADQCGTPVVFAAVTRPATLQFFREIPFDRTGDPEDYLVSEDIDTMAGIVFALGPNAPIDEFLQDPNMDFQWVRRIEINGYPALHMGFAAGYQRPGDPPGKTNPVVANFLTVRDNDRVAVFFSMAPARFWEEYKTLLVTMLQSFRFTSGPQPPTPTSTPTATFILAPANQTPTAGGFMYDGMNLQIPNAELAYDCYKAFRKAYPEEYAGLPNFVEPAGTNCLLVVISTIPGQEPLFDLETIWNKLRTFTGATMIDQAQNSYSPQMDGLHGFGDRAWTNLYFFVDPSATSFKLILPDERGIPISPVLLPPPRPQAASPVPTFTPLPNTEAYYSATPQPSDRKFIDEYGVEMVFIPAGAFQMGRSESQNKAACLKLKGRCDGFWDNDPEHAVTLDAFYMDVLEVTNARYAECVAAGVCLPPGSNQSATRSSYYGNPKFDDYPVILVDWQMARTYCQWRNADLPTEAQWEKAARGTDGRWFPWGDDLDGTHANFNDVNSSRDGGRKDLNDGYADTAPVDAFPEGVSPYGILNLAGNVWEWVLDDYSAVFYEESPPNNPIASDQTGDRVIRGGSWSAFNVFTLWVSYRDRSNPFDWDYMIGFRCARSP